MQQYHDTEWGVPVHDNTLLFEHLTLDCFQAGLSWQTVLNKRDNFRDAFNSFDIRKVAGYTSGKIDELLSNKGIIRNSMKIEAAINNANCILEIQKRGTCFNDFLWHFIDHKPIINTFRSTSEIPATSEISDLISKELKKQGFKFVGSTVIYAFMQAIGMVNDHIVTCFRYPELVNH
ncbi:MAG: DNA-3-methyladenine glycosylase I [Bacteroidales bacterium]|nr:DNA-3-methyladenine glycosylase I [Bacteroidales bacterium]